MQKNNKQKGKETKRDDIFQEASKSPVKKTIITLDDADVITESNILVKYDKTTRKTFNELKTAVDNEHAERFNDLLHSLPDREFVRVYLKVLEFFKPKVIRQLGDGDPTKDTDITITIKR